MKLKSLLKSILKSTWEFFFHSILGLFLLSIGSLSTIAILFRDMLKDVLNINITPNPQHLKVYHLLLILFILIVLYILIKFVKRKIGTKKIYKKHEFIIVDGFAWKVNRRDASVLPKPYCEDHKMKLVSHFLGGFAAAGYRRDYFCAECNRVVRRDLNDEDMKLIYQIAKNKAEQLQDNGIL